MNEKEFKEKYPNVTLGMSREVQKLCSGSSLEKPGTIDTANEELVKHNIRELVNALPEEYRIILNQRGLRISIGKENQAIHARFLSNTDFYKAPSEVELRFDDFHTFSYEKDGLFISDSQRHAELLLKEEMHHALYLPFIELPKMQQAAKQDLAAENYNRDRSLKAAQSYGAAERRIPYIVSENKCEVPFLTQKQSLKHYRQQEDTDIAAELMVEMTQIRELLTVAKKYTPKSFTGDSEATKQLKFVIRDFATIHGGIPSKTMSDEEFNTAVDAYMIERFPNAYPLLKDYEGRIKKLAEDIKHDPASYPAKSRGFGVLLPKWSARTRNDRWTEHFSDIIAANAAVNGFSKS